MFDDLVLQNRDRPIRTATVRERKFSVPMVAVNFSAP